MLTPDFIIAGAAKCGTTTIASVLGSQPGIFLAKEKEPKYFSAPYRPKILTGPGDEAAYCSKPRTLSDYVALFQQARSKDVKGEASTDYLYYAQCAKDIRRTCG